MTTSLSTARTHLETLHLTLHHLNHRNRNQHRLAKWYKSLAQFMRQSKRLGTEVGVLEGAWGVDPCYVVGRGKGRGKSKKESKFTIAAREKLGARIEFLTRYMVGRWYLAFTTLTADNQYAALGLMLLGSLARFQTVIKQVAKEIDLVLDKDLEIPEIIQSQEGISDLGLLQGKGDGGVDDVGEVVSREAFGTLGLEGRDVGDGEGEDVGSLRGSVVEKEKKRRKEVVEDVEGEGNDGRSGLVKKKKKRNESGEEVVSVKGESMKVKKSKKKKKKGDAFDDLFGGLI